MRKDLPSLVYKDTLQVQYQVTKINSTVYNQFLCPPPATDQTLTMVCIVGEDVLAGNGGDYILTNLCVARHRLDRFLL